MSVNLDNEYEYQRRLRAEGERWARELMHDYAARFELTDKGKAEVAPESDAMAFLRRRIKLSERLSLIEQAHWQRSRHEDTDSSSAQPHRFGSAG